MAEKAHDNAEAKAQIEEEESEDEEEEIIMSDRESEEGVDRDEDEKPASPKKKAPPKSPKKKKPKVTSGGMQIPEYWPWEEAKKLFITPDVVKADDMEVSQVCVIGAGTDDLGRLEGARCRWLG
jgi:flap endonuclease-1